MQRGEAARRGTGRGLGGAGKRIREDFMHYAWINDLLVAGARALLPQSAT